MLCCTKGISYFNVFCYFFFTNRFIGIYIIAFNITFFFCVILLKIYASTVYLFFNSMISIQNVSKSHHPRTLIFCLNIGSRCRTEHLCIGFKIIIKNYKTRNKQTNEKKKIIELGMRNVYVQQKHIQFKMSSCHLSVCYQHCCLIANFSLLIDFWFEYSMVLRWMDIASKSNNGQKNTVFYTISC